MLPTGWDGRHHRQHRPTFWEAVQDGMQAAVPFQIVVLEENPPEIQDGTTVLGQEPGQQGMEGLGAALLLLQPECLLK